jgi:dienelactone hydrolase
MDLPGFETSSFTYEGKTRTVYRRGTGPAVVIMHELPGITPPVADFANRVAAEGFSVFMPWMFGTPGKPLSKGYLICQEVRVCLNREFRMFAARKSSPITDWLRALCRHAHQQCGGPGVGAIGMCLTGGFALSLMVDPVVMAPVLSQPSLPALPFTQERKAALGVAPEELAVAKERCAAGVTILGMRFTNDPLCPPERFERLRKEFGEGFTGIEIDSSPGNPYGNPPNAHSVVTTHLVDKEGHPTREALDAVLALFRRRLIEDKLG